MEKSVGVCVSFLIAEKGRNKFPKGVMLATEVQHALYLREVGEAEWA